MDFIKAPYLQGGRSLCVTGACVLTASEDLLGDSIRLFEGKGAWCSHAAPVVRFPGELIGQDRVTLIEALEHGLTPTYLSHYFSNFKGRIFLFFPMGMTAPVQQKFAFWLMDKMFTGTAYAYSQLLEQVGGRVQEDTASMFCSEAYGCALEAAGLTRKSDAPVGVAPQPPDISDWWEGYPVVELTGPFQESK